MFGIKVNTAKSIARENNAVAAQLVTKGLDYRAAGRNKVAASLLRQALVLTTDAETATDINRVLRSL